MPRIVKAPEVRRQELLDAAEAVFSEKGYDNTTIGDVVAKLKVAHGLFYYYFKSKSDALSAIIERYLQRMDERAEEIITNEELDPPAKVLALFRLSIEGRKSNRYLDYLHEEKNAVILYRFERRQLPLSISHMTRVVEEGVREGIFVTDHANETAGGLLMVMNLVGVYDTDPASFDIRRGLAEPLQEQMERLLCAKAGTLDGFEDLWTGLEVDY
jgi:AcrR family transcriptional regulator